MSEESGEGMVYHMVVILRNSRAWYEQKIGEREKERERGRERDDGDGKMDTSFMEILPTLLGRCSDFWTVAEVETERETESEEMRGKSDDEEGNGVWSDMLGSWPGQEIGVGMGSGIG